MTDAAMPEDAPPPAPSTGSSDPQQTELRPEEEPLVTGTLFLTLLFLMLLFGFWVMMYLILLNR